MCYCIVNIRGVKKKKEYYNTIDRYIISKWDNQIIDNHKGSPDKLTFV